MALALGAGLFWLGLWIYSFVRHWREIQADEVGAALREHLRRGGR